MKKLQMCDRSSWRSFAKVALLLLLLSVSANIVAQLADGVQLPQRAIRRDKRDNPEERVKVLAKYLELDERQQAALQKILGQRQHELLQMRFAPIPSGSTQIDRFRAIEGRTVERIRAVLNDEQRNKYDLLAPRRLTSPQKVNVKDWLKAAGSR